ncbi:hypothetical protein ACEQ8H_006875 [Pleosporales sp. CAS-2024a]
MPMGPVHDGDWYPATTPADLTGYIRNALQALAGNGETKPGLSPDWDFSKLIIKGEEGLETLKMERHTGYDSCQKLSTSITPHLQHRWWTMYCWYLIRKYANRDPIIHGQFFMYRNVLKANANTLARHYQLNRPPWLPD